MNSSYSLQKLTEAHCDDLMREADEYRRVTCGCDPVLSDVFHLAQAAVALVALAVVSWFVPL